MVMYESRYHVVRFLVFAGFGREPLFNPDAPGKAAADCGIRHAGTFDRALDDSSQKSDSTEV